MNQQIAQKWVEELRSGKHKQAKDIMEAADGGLCCLGVLAKIVEPETPLKGLDLLTPRMSGKCSMRSLNGRFREFNESTPGYSGRFHVLSELNDLADWNFTQIADFIEQNWEIL